MPQPCVRDRAPVCQAGAWRSQGRYETRRTSALDSQETLFAIDAVAEAARIAIGVSAEMKESDGDGRRSSLNKNDQSPVTVADFAIQACIGYRLSQRFPSDPLVAEENSEPLRRAGSEGVAESVHRWVRSLVPEASVDDVMAWLDLGAGKPQGVQTTTPSDGSASAGAPKSAFWYGRRFWALDPIDGTKGFLRRKHYAIALAFIEDGEVRAAAMACPRWNGSGIGCRRPGAVVAAARGGGTWWRSLQADPAADFARLRVSGQDDPTLAILLRSVESGHTNDAKMALLRRRLGAQAAPVCMDSQAKYAALAAGQGDILFRLLRREKPDYREKIWDQAAGSLVLEEAGGKITDLEGKALNFLAGRTLADNRGILASNALLHDSALEAVRAVDG